MARRLRARPDVRAEWAPRVLLQRSGVRTRTRTASCRLVHTRTGRKEKRGSEPSSGRRGPAHARTCAAAPVRCGVVPRRPPHGARHVKGHSQLPRRNAGSAAAAGAVRLRWGLGLARGPRPSARARARLPADLGKAAGRARARATTSSSKRQAPLHASRPAAPALSPAPACARPPRRGISSFSSLSSVPSSRVGRGQVM